MKTRLYKTLALNFMLCLMLSIFLTPSAYAVESDKSEQVTIPKDVTVIEDEAFMNCSSLTSITIPVGVTTIGDSAFYGCIGLKDVYFEGTEKQWDEITIGTGNAPLTGAAIHCIGYPSKAIRAICPWSAGGLTDMCLRAFCSALEKQLGQTITVCNQTGASGVIGHEAIADADPDGYTFGMISWELSSYAPQDMSEYTYENYTPLCLLNTNASAITVNSAWAAENNITDLESFIAYCKDHPGEVIMGGASYGSVWHVGCGYLMNEADIDINMITYQDGAASAARAAAQGEITGVTIPAAEARSFVESGDLTLLAIMSAERSPVFPDIPTCQEQGYDYVWGTWRGISLPLDVDADVLETLSKACAAAVEDPNFVEFMDNVGQTISYLNAKDFTAFLAQEKENVPSAMITVGLIEAEG